MVELPKSMRPEAARALFLGLPPVTVAEMDGYWHGGSLSTGHPLDSLLLASGWIGKEFRDGEADPLVMRGAFGRYRLNPGLLPLGAAMALRLDLWPFARPVFSLLGPLLSTRTPRARLRMVDYGGTVSAAMVYDQKPIIDHFRRLDDQRLLGLMDRRGDRAPCFFTLTKAARGAAARAR